MLAVFLFLFFYYFYTNMFTDILIPCAFVTFLNKDYDKHHKIGRPSRWELTSSVINAVNCLLAYVSFRLYQVYFLLSFY